jgi:small subunit ribosomal protein S17
MPDNDSPPPAAAGEKRARRKTRVGVVVSDKMEKTIVVSVVRRVPHPKFGKIIKKTTKLYAADERSEAKAGDRVKVVECRPLSKLKRWRLVEVLKH